jgi:hypothetical protein
VSRRPADGQDDAEAQVLLGNALALLGRAPEAEARTSILAGRVGNAGRADRSDAFR